MEGGGTQHEEEGKGNNGHVTEVERSLQNSRHATSVVVVVKTVHINQQTRHTAVDKGGPPPAMIFSGQLEVQESDSDECCDNDQQNECQEEDSKESVNLVSPHGGEDVMKLDVNGSERQEPGNQDLEITTTVPWDFGWDFTSDLGGAGRGVEVRASVILGHDTSHDSERDTEEGVKSGDSQNSSEWESRSRSVSESNTVDPHENGNDRDREQSGSEEDASDPQLSIHLTVQSNSCVTSNEGQETEKDDDSGQDGSTPVG